MTAREVIISLMEIKGMTMQQLAERAGYKDKSAVSNRISGNGMNMKVSTLVRLLDELDAELVVMPDIAEEFTLDGWDEGVDYKRNDEKDWC